MSDNVIDIKTRKTKTQQIEEIAERETEKLAQKQAALSKHQEDLLVYIDQVRDLVEAGHLETLIIISRHVTTGLYHTAAIIDSNATELNKLYGHIGVLETMKLELMDVVSMAPAYMEDGTILDPQEVQIDDELGDTDD